METATHPGPLDLADHLATNRPPKTCGLLRRDLPGYDPATGYIIPAGRCVLGEYFVLAGLGYDDAALIPDIPEGHWLATKVTELGVYSPFGPPEPRDFAQFLADLSDDSGNDWEPVIMALRDFAEHGANNLYDV